MSQIDTEHSLILLDELSNFAKKFSQNLKAGDVVSLVGDLGSGKTTFLFSLMTVMGMSPDQGFSSPTFTILNQYLLKKWQVNHLDLYRLNEFREFESLDVTRFFHQPNTVTFIEWGDKFSELESIFTKKIIFEYTDKPDLRKISVSIIGA